jgi:arylsulfatase A-like enzyme
LNVILVVSDTFRYDHLGANGNKRIVTPNLDRFAKEALVFDRCYPASFPTIPARADIHTGRLTFTYRGWQPLAQEEVTLAQTLHDGGYNTMAVVDVPFFAREGYGYDRGFDDFVYVRGQRAGAEMANTVRERRYEVDHCAPGTFFTAERWLQQHYKEKFFLYVDAWDPHEPWDAPNWYTEIYRPDYDGRAVIPPYGKWKEAGMKKEDVETGHDCYCGEITMVDRWFGRLMDTLRLLRIEEETTVIFTSDHGFYFGEHGYFGKAVMDQQRVLALREFTAAAQFFRSPLYEEVTHVPLMIRSPDVRPGRRDSLASVSDIMPTILDFAGVPIPKTVQSSSLVPLVKGEAKAVHDSVVTSMPLYNTGEHTRVVDQFDRRIAEVSPSTITSKNWTLLYALKGEPVELYDLASDPKQEENVFDAHKDVAKKLHAEFVDCLRKNKAEKRLIDARVSL